MNKTIIANKGISNQGKSSSIKNVAKEILEQFPTAISSQNPINYEEDINVIITIDNIKIGIESQGDPNSRIFTSLPGFAKKGCDIILCASRSNGETVNVIERTKSTYDYNLIWVTNPRSSAVDSHEFLNSLFTNQVIDIIKTFINIEHGK